MRDFWACRIVHTTEPSQAPAGDSGHQAGQRPSPLRLDRPDLKWREAIDSPSFMRREHLSLLCCPECRGALELVDSAEHDARVETGSLRCVRCHSNYSIVRHIPRFVSSDNYSAGFGLQWNLHSRTQLD